MLELLNDVSLNFCFTPPGVVSLSQALCSSDDYSNSLLHLDLSKNPGVLSGEDATVGDSYQAAWPMSAVFIKFFLSGKAA